MRLSEEGMFILLKDILNSKETSLLLKSTAVVMITSVLNSNSKKIFQYIMETYCI